MLIYLIFRLRTFIIIVIVIIIIVIVIIIIIIIVIVIIIIIVAYVNINYVDNNEIQVILLHHMICDQMWSQSNPNISMA